MGSNPARRAKTRHKKTGQKILGQPVNPKTFRSIFVSTMVYGNVPLPLVSRFVGHEDIQTTQSHYYALSADRRRAIGEGIPV